MTLQGFVAKALKLTHLSVNQNSFARKQLVPHKVVVFKILSKVLHRIWEQNMKHCVEVLSFCKPPILQNLKLSKYQRILDIHVNIRFRCHNLIFVFHHKLRFHFKKLKKMFPYFFIRVTIGQIWPFLLKTMQIWLLVHQHMYLLMMVQFCLLFLLQLEALSRFRIKLWEKYTPGTNIYFLVEISGFTTWVFQD